jgi:hypothetical protein
MTETDPFGKFAQTNKYIVATNPANEKKVSVGPDAWPDIVVYDPSTKNDKKIGDAKRIGEVETEDTVTIDHAKGHWDAYQKLVSDFILAVPKSSVDAAKGILKDLNATCTLWSYQVTRDKDGKRTASFALEK